MQHGQQAINMSCHSAFIPLAHADDPWYYMGMGTVPPPCMPLQCMALLQLVLASAQATPTMPGNQAMPTPEAAHSHPTAAAPGSQR